MSVNRGLDRSRRLALMAPGVRVFETRLANQDADRLRELRPRAGRSPWRAFYRQIRGVIFVVGAIGPEAAVKPRDFVRAVRRAEDRLNKIEQDEEGH